MILAVDATTKTASSAIYHNGKIIADFTLNNGYTHSQTLLPMIAQALEHAACQIADLEAIIVANGPGSFTGIRIALATVKGLAHSDNIPIYTTSTLRALRYHGRYFDGLVCPILDARRNQVYAAVYDQKGALIYEESTYLIDQLCEQLAANRVLFVGDAVAVHAKRIKEILPQEAVLADLSTVNNTAVGLIDAYLAGHAARHDYDQVSALYLRKPQAEREREAKQ